MDGKPCYRRIDAGEAMAKGLAGVFPASWKPAEENASIEVWLKIQKMTAFCGVRLSDKNMRHRTYKSEHLAASLRPTVAAAMVRLAGASAGQIVLDPMCGAGTILAEQIELSKQRRAGIIHTIGGDIDFESLRAAVTNLQKVGPTILAQWDANRLPFGNESIDRIISNPPFGKQILTKEEIVPLYQGFLKEYDRILKPGGRAVLITSEAELLRDIIQKYRWQPMRELRVEILGLPAIMSVWQKNDSEIR